jgi:hypothetical protein
MNYCNVIANLRVLLRDARREIRVLSHHRLGHMVDNRAPDPRRVRLFFECTVCRNRSRSVNGYRAHHCGRHGAVFSDRPGSALFAQRQEWWRRWLRHSATLPSSTARSKGGFTKKKRRI